MADLPHEIRSIMIPVTGSNVLLPNADVTDILTYMQPDPVPDAPGWLLGRIHWRGWRVPVFSLPVLAGRLGDEDRARARIIVLKALGGNAKMPFLGLLAQGFPHLTTITPDVLVPAIGQYSDRMCVCAEVRIRDEGAVIPDLDAIEGMVAKALAA